MGDPGFLSGLIGWVIGFAMGFIVEQIRIVFSFPEQLEKLKSQKEYASYCGQNSSCSPELKIHLKNVSPLVESSSALRWFNIISRYVMCKRMTTLISKIEMNQHLFFFHICGAASGKMQKEVEGEVPVEKKAASGNFLSRWVSTRVVGATALGAAATALSMIAWNYFNTGRSAQAEKKPTEAVPVLSEPSLAQTGPTRALAEDGPALPLAEDAAPAPVVSVVTVDATGPTRALAQDPSALALAEEAPVVSVVTVDATGPTRVLAQDPSALALAEKAPVVSVVTVDATGHTPALAQDPSALALVEEAAPAPVVSMVTVDATPAVPEMASKEEVESTNRGSVSGFMGILEQMTVDFSGRKQLASLEDLAMEIRPTITVLKDRINYTAHGNGSAVQAWFKRLEQHLQNADGMIKEYKGHFIYNCKTRKSIRRLTSEINALLKLGQMIISFECLKNEMII